MRQYLDLLQDVLDNGQGKSDPHGVGSIAVCGRTTRFDLSKGEFPMLTTKKLHFKSIAIELLWFLSGETNIQFGMNGQLQKFLKKWVCLSEM